MDVVYLGVILVFFALAFAYAALCDRL